MRAWQRYEIAARLEAGYSKKSIAEYLHAHPSTITGEIQRNRCCRYRVYKAKIAQERAEHRWRCRKLPRRIKEDVRAKVDELIRKDYSAEQIAGQCRRPGKRWCLTKPSANTSGGTKPTEVTCTNICVTGEDGTRNIGECKWTSGESGRLLTNEIQKSAADLPFTKGKQVEIVLFTKVAPVEDIGNAILPYAIIELNR